MGDAAHMPSSARKNPVSKSLGWQKGDNRVASFVSASDKRVPRARCVLPEADKLRGFGQNPTLWFKPLAGLTPNNFSPTG